MKFFPLKFKQGFTLIELLLYVAVSSLLLLAASGLLSALLEARVKNQTINEVEQQGLQLMHSISQALRNAGAITAPTTSTTSGGLTIDTTIFDLSSGVVRIKEGAAAAVPLTNSRVAVSNLNFSNLSRPQTPGNIRIEFTMSRVNTSGRKEFEYSRTFVSTASLRHP